MLDLYVLFSPINAVDQEGAPLPTALVPLKLDDEIQYRCAGYMQAEIERYAELISETEDKKQPSEKESGSESDDSAVEKPQKAATAKKQPAQTTKAAEKQSMLPASCWCCFSYWV